MNRTPGDCGIYFSFHDEEDHDRAEIVMSFSDSKALDVPSIWSNQAWEEANAEGPQSVEQRIADALAGTQATCLLIGANTVDKPWIRPVLRMSHERGNGIFAVYIHTIPDYNGTLGKKGFNPMGNLKYIGKGNREYPYASYYFSYDWKLHNGPERFNYWAEIAVSQVMKAGW